MADAIIAVSGATKHDIERLFNVDPARVHVIHNGIDLNQYRKVDSNWRPQALRYRSGQAISAVCGTDHAPERVSASGARNPIHGSRFPDRAVRSRTRYAGDWPRKCGLLSNAHKRSGPESSGSTKWSINRPPANFTRTPRCSFVRRSTNRLASLILRRWPARRQSWPAAVGGIKEVVVDGETGFLVPLEQMKESPFEAINPEKFARDIAERVNELMRDRQLRERFGKAGRERVEEHFSWTAIAEKTKKLYETLKS